MITFDGETEAWSACFLAAISSLDGREEDETYNDVADEAEGRANAAVHVLDRRAKARAAARDAELMAATEKVTAQETYRRHGEIGRSAEVWTLSQINGNVATLSRPLRPGEREPTYAASVVARTAKAPGFETGANVFALAACTVDAPDEDTGFMPWTAPADGAAS